MTGPDGPITEAAAPIPEPEPIAPPPFEAEPATFEDDLVAVEPEVEEPPPPVRRTALRDRQPPKENAGKAIVWASVAVLLIALLAGAVVFREQIVRVWPQSGVAFAGLGLQVQGAGLVLEKVDVKPAFLAGRPVLAVTGAIRNVRGEPVSAPPLRLTLLNRAGQAVAAKIARPEDAAIPAHATRHFSITMIDPPSTARDLEVRFDASAAKGHARTQPVSAPAPVTPHAAPEPAHAAPVGGAHPAPPHHPAQASPPPPQLSPAAATEHG